MEENFQKKYSLICQEERHAPKVFFPCAVRRNYSECRRDIRIMSCISTLCYTTQRLITIDRWLTEWGHKMRGCTWGIGQCSFSLSYGRVLRTIWISFLCAFSGPLTNGVKQHGQPGTKNRTSINGRMARRAIFFYKQVDFHISLAVSAILSVFRFNHTI